MIPDSLTDKLSYKQGLKSLCVSMLRMRVDDTRQAMDSAQQSANSEEKSSAGDKYETGRAMSMIDRDRNAKRLDELMQELLLLQSIQVDQLHENANNGAVIICGDKVYFIAAGLGVIEFDTEKIIVLSPRAPLSNLMRGKKRGETAVLNGNTFTIDDVF